MTHLPLQRKNGGELSLDLCFSCQGIWFDKFESEQLTPGSVIELFKLIHAHRDEDRHTIPATLRCPRCNDRLKASLDMTRSGRFTYHRCLQNHGRFTVFAQFMIEKGFVRQLAPAEVKALAARIGSIHCTGCGAPVDIRTQAACQQCGAPIAILDPDAVNKALAGFQAQETLRTHPDPEALAEAILRTERQRSPSSRTNFSAGDLILSGIGMTLELLDR